MAESCEDLFQKKGTSFNLAEDILSDVGTSDGGFNIALKLQEQNF